MPRTFEKMSGEHWYNFTQAVTPTSLCGPARASLLTGQTVDHHGMNCNVGNTEVCKKWAAARSKLVPKALADVGVWVGWYGKRVNWDHECKGEGPNAGWPNLPGVVDDHVHYDDKTAMFNAYQLVENGVSLLEPIPKSFQDGKQKDVPYMIGMVGTEDAGHFSMPVQLVPAANSGISCAGGSFMCASHARGCAHPLSTSTCHGVVPRCSAANCVSTTW